MFSTLFLKLLLLAGVVAAINSRHRDKLYPHKDNNFMKELPTKTYGSNLANGTAAEREILMEF